MIALAGFLAGPGALIMGAKGKMRHAPNAHWRVVSALVLAIPAVVDFSIPDYGKTSFLNSSVERFCQ
jgi:hypothetical protein